MAKIKLNVLLAMTDHLASVYKKGLEDYLKFFKTSQGSFKGEKKTYEPKTGAIDIPSERLNKLVVTTVDEKLTWLQDNSKEYINALFSQEKTNASGTVNAKLTVEGIDFGIFSTLELLRLKTILEHGTFKEMYENIPVRNDDELWTKSSNEMYGTRNIYESNLRTGVNKSVLKEHYILPDPNIDKIKGDYKPQVSQKDTVMELGDFTYQKFSGEASHLERAMILARRSKLLTAVIAALKQANEAEVIPSEMTADKLFNYLHKGKL